jgi:hypothetical protein
VSGRAGSSRGRVRIALAVVATLAVVASLTFALLDRGPRARARQPETGNLSGLAAEVQANIAAQREQSIEHRAGVDRHELADPDDQPPAAEVPAITAADRLVRRWLSGYLPYEVGRLDSRARQQIAATSTAGLSRALLARPPLIPPAQQRHSPPRGRLLGLTTTITGGGQRASVYVSVAYGLEREGFRLTLTRSEHGWLVEDFRG